MNQQKPFFAVFALIQSLLGIHSLKITLDAFESRQCDIPEGVCKSAIHQFNITGRIMLDEGEVMPPYIAFEYKCPKPLDCATHEGRGENWWEWLHIIPAGKCNYELYDAGCHLLNGSTYRYFYEQVLYYLYRFCSVRARLIDVQRPKEYAISVNATGIKHVSNELKFSDYRNDSRYFAEMDSIMDMDYPDGACVGELASKNGEKQIYLSEDALMFWGTFIAISIIS